MSKTWIDTDWFIEQLRQKGMRQSDLARALMLDRSAVSRLLKGERRMMAEEQDEIARIFGLSVVEVAAHRAAGSAGFGERKQDGYLVDAGSSSLKDIPDAELPDHPIFGCMAGTVTVMPGIDLTEPIDFEWGQKLYNE